MMDQIYEQTNEWMKVQTNDQRTTNQPTQQTNGCEGEGRNPVQTKLTMANHGRPRTTMVSHKLPWLKTMVPFNKTLSKTIN